MTCGEIDEFIDLFLLDPVYTYKRLQDVHVGIRRKLSTKYLLRNKGAHFLGNTATDTDPGLAFLQKIGDIGRALTMALLEFSNQPCLLQDIEALCVGHSQKFDNSGAGIIG